MCSDYRLISCFRTSRNPCCSNPIGMLQEYCSKRRLMLPIYQALPHETEMFVIACTFEELTFYGMNS